MTGRRCLSFALLAFGAAAEPAHAKRLVVGFRADVSSERQAAILQAAGARNDAWP